LPLQLQELVTRASARYASQPSRVLRALARASRTSRCSRSWRSSALIWARAPYLSRARCSSSCRQQTETNERRTTRNKHEDDRTRKKATTSYLEDMPRRATVDLQRLVQCSVERSAVATQLLPQLLLLTVKIRQPSHEFTYGVGMSFIPYPLVLTPVV
jgi:hypothetical protein